MMGRLRESKWVYVLLSVLLAVLFWFYVRAEVDPTQPYTIHNVREMCIRDSPRRACRGRLPWLNC